MSVVPGGIDTDEGPPMTIPLRHFLVGVGLLLAGALVGLRSAVGGPVVGARLVHVHLLLAGWVCVTIMGAMTQFVPVWSNVPLYSRRLATAQLWLVTAGLAGFAAAFLGGRPALLAFPGALLLAGFWTFVYNIGRTLARARPLDVTERHFALALLYFLAVTALGLSLAVGYARPVYTTLPVSRTGVVTAHATLAVFGAVLTTVFGALYQLATMFTQTDLHGIDHPLRGFEEVGYPLGVVALAAGRLFDASLLATAGGLLVAAVTVAVSVILLRRLYETRVERTPMLTRYGAAALFMPVWAATAARSWLRDPTSRTTLLGDPATGHLLVFGVVGFVVLGTLYHVVPFIVWVHRYSDRLGLEDVPMIDDLYSGRLAAVDFAATLAGALGLFVAAAFSLSTLVTAAAGAVATLGFACFGANALAVVRDHSPYSLAGVLFTGVASDRNEATDEGDGTQPDPAETLDRGA